MAALRYMTSHGTERSYLVWFRPSSERVRTDAEVQAAVSAAKGICRRAFENAIGTDSSLVFPKPAQDLVGLADCLSKALLSSDGKQASRGVLCLPIMKPHNVATQIAGSDVTAFTVSLIDEWFGELRNVGAAGCWTLLTAPFV